MTTERQEEDFAAIAWMIRHGSSSWSGPTPQAEQARWASEPARRPVGHRRMIGLRGVVFTALVFFTVLAVASAATPGGLMSVPRTVSEAFSQKAPRGPLGPTLVGPSAAPEPGQNAVPAQVSPPAQTGGVVHTSVPGSVQRPSPAAQPSASPSPRPTDE